MLDSNLHLFVDDSEVHHYRNLLRVLNRPRRHPEPVLKGDRPWEGGTDARVQAWGSVIRELDGLFRMWYIGFGTIEGVTYCYAESGDGIHWEKPNLGTVEWRGSRENNLFFGFGGEDLWERGNKGQGIPARDLEGKVIGLLTNMDGMTVFRDDSDPDPQRRYKCIGNMQDHRMFAGFYKAEYPNVTEEQVARARETMGNYLAGVSPDGIHWQWDPRMLVHSRYGDYMMVMRDERNGRWWMNERPPGLGGRNVGLRYSVDLIHWTDPPEPIFMNGPEGGFGQFWEWHNGITPFNYGNLDLGFLEYWHNAGTGDYCELVSHRDGGRWERVAPGRPFLDVGPEGWWDRCLVYPTHNPPIRVGDELYIYYTGAGVGSWPAQDYTASIGLMTLGLDRFAGLAHTRQEPGTMVTKPVVVSGRALQINVEPSIRTVGVRVGLKRPDWTDIEGYAQEDCIPTTENGFRLPVRWKDKQDVRELMGQSVVLEFKVAGMTLYSFCFSDEETDARESAAADA